MSIDLKKFESRLQSYVRKYPYCETDPYDFDEFWRWKLETEGKGKSILDLEHRRDTYRKLSKALPKWRTYRPYNSTDCLKLLEQVLDEIAESYNQLRSYSLLEFSKIPTELLERAWHQLGRVKEEKGKSNPEGYYYIVAISKPLLFLWGQTLAFDSIVRRNMPRFGIYSYLISGTRWNFENWRKIMEQFSNVLHNEPRIVDAFSRVSEKRYGSNKTVPHGRFLDIYYYMA